jgi:hypothetical protein
MGYEHYWVRPEILAPKIFVQWSADVRRIIHALPNDLIRDDAGISEPETSDECVCFNGNVEQYTFLESFIAYSQGIFDEESIQKTMGHISDAGMPFAVPQILDKSFQKGGLVLRDQRGWFRTSCKTGGKPYDIAVVAALIMMKHRFPSSCEVESDGAISGWKHGLELAMRATGLELRIPETIETR